MRRQSLKRLRKLARIQYSLGLGRQRGVIERLLNTQHINTPGSTIHTHTHTLACPTAFYVVSLSLPFTPHPSLLRNNTANELQ